MSRPRQIEVKQGKRFLARGADFVRIGKGATAKPRIDDPLLKDEHFEIRAGADFRIEDLGSSTGTYVDGRPAHEAPVLTDGSRIVAGTTAFGVKLEGRDDAVVLVLELEKGTFHLKRGGSTDSDHNQWVRDELAMSRFPKLSVGNRAAAVIGVVLAVAGVIGTTLLEPLVDAGPLMCTHAALFDGAAAGDDVTAELASRGRTLESYLAANASFVEIASEQGCAACHDGGSLPESKCMQCHDVDFRGGAGDGGGAFRHPYVTASGNLDGLDALGLGADFCVECHVDHDRPAWLKPSTEGLGADCAHCHQESRETMVAKWSPPEPPLGERRYATYFFPHGVHVARDMDCDVCHVEAPEGRFDAAQFGSAENPVGFAAVDFETVCAACHVAPDSPLAAGVAPDLAARITAHDEGLTPAERIAKAWRPTSPPSQGGRELVWAMDWHGSDDAAETCGGCHAATGSDGDPRYGPGLRTVERPRFDLAATLAFKARYELDRYAHDEQFANHAGGKECSECHRRTDPADLVAERRGTGTFWHALHMPLAELEPVDATEQQRVSAESCAQCHDDVARAEGLVAGDFWRWTPDENRTTGDNPYADCRECHGDGALAGPNAIRAARVDATRELPVAATPDFPHDAHPIDAIDGGCFACHTFPASREGAEYDFERTVLTTPQAKNCLPCHERHQDIQDDSCAVCHPGDGRSETQLPPNVYTQAAGLMRGAAVTVSAGRPTRELLATVPTREASMDRGFSHFSPGHLPRVRDIDGRTGNAACTTCHSLEERDGVPGLLGNRRLADVHIPNDADDTWSCRDCHLDHQYHWRSKPTAR